ncbi:hypothetical protein EWM62_14485 [Mucilaginibacter terrigena]|uniref:Uncharacterized protein n=1 Tax=Mucilaginibacter terrigena TaxID=2492395 RepID=A0A4Q5LJJ3_9SPHI|nr:hypothetical protein [Mucilaginibacter terrigena]RYU89523.1 hypothetical protein EWM62_14485 [Mucilaginibacter terrigena]
MMKKAGVILLVLMYMVTSSGFALNLHYCGNIVVAVKVNAPPKPCAKPPGASKSKMKCCKDVKVDVKVKDGHESQPNSSVPKTTTFDLPKLSLGDFLMPAQQALMELFFDRDPPDAAPKQNVPVFLKNRTLKI